MHYGWIIFIVLSFAILAVGVTIFLSVFIPQWKARQPVAYRKIAPVQKIEAPAKKVGCGCSAPLK